METQIPMIFHESKEFVMRRWLVSAIAVDSVAFLVPSFVFAAGQDEEGSAQKPA